MKKKIGEKLAKAVAIAESQPVAGILFTLTVTALIAAMMLAYNSVVPAYQ